MRMSLEDVGHCLGLDMDEKISMEAKKLVPGAVRIDSRLLKPGDLFVCLPGKRVDGHDFAEQAVQIGVSAIIAERDPFGGKASPVPLFLVESSIKALGRMASCHRFASQAKVIGITGTAGKTSVKEVLAAVLAVRGATSRNHSNMNNQIGLPLSILDADLDDSFWVMEAGISEAHDMDELGAILAPDLAIILNVGQGHLSGLGDKGVAYYKARFLAHISQSGIALVSADYPELVLESSRHGRGVVHFSTRCSDVDYCATYLGPASAATGRYKVTLRGKSYEMVAPFRGNFGSENVAAIAGAAHLAGLTPEEITVGLAGASLPKQRFCCNVLSAPANAVCQGGEWMMIDDSYNANPLSTERMLEAAGEMAKEGRRPLVLVMGEMLELGAEAEAAHNDIGKKMAGAALVIWKGGQAQAVERGLQEAGYAGVFKTVQSADDFRALMPGVLSTALGNSGVVLFKASRGNHLEELAEIFKTEFGQGIGR